MHPYGMHPGMYSPGVPAQRVPLPPRQTIIMPSQPSTAPIITTPTMVPNSTFAPGNTSIQAPAPRQNPTTLGPSSADKAVPEPRDPSAETTPEGSAPDRTSDARKEMGFVAPIRTQHQFGLQDFGRSMPETTRSRSTPTLTRAGAVSLQPIDQVGYDNTSSHHPEFAWIQGRLQYDAARQSWHLMYDDNPGRDQWGGEVQLIGNLPFRPSDHNKLFRVYGQAHPKLTDRLNKPQYEVTDVEPLASIER